MALVSSKRNKKTAVSAKTNSQSKNKKKKFAGKSQRQTDDILQEISIVEEQEVIDISETTMIGAFEGGLVNKSFLSMSAINYPKSTEGALFAAMLDMQSRTGSVYINDIHEKVSFHTGGGLLLL